MLSFPDLQHFTADMLHHAVILTSDPLAGSMFVMYWLWHDQILDQILAKLNNTRLSYASFQNDVGSKDIVTEKWGQIEHFLTPGKNQGVDKIAEWKYWVVSMTKVLVCIRLVATAWSVGAKVRLKK